MLRCITFISYAELIIDKNINKIRVKVMYFSDNLNIMKSEDGFVTNVITTPGNTYDGDILAPVLL